MSINGIPGKINHVYGYIMYRDQNHERDLKQNDGRRRQWQEMRATWLVYEGS